MTGCNHLRTFTALAAFLAASPAWADEHVWTGATDLEWGTAGNWAPAGPPVSGDTAVINLGAGADLAITLTGAQACGTVTISTPRNVTISGGGTLTIDNGASIIRDSAATGATGYTISCNVAFGANGAIGSNATSSPFTFSGLISGGGTSLTVTGGADLTGGEVVFSGTSANTLSGIVTVTRGRLILNKTAGLSAVGTGSLSVGNYLPSAVTATARLDADNQIADVATIYVINGSTLDLNNHNDTLQPPALIQGATIQTGTGTMTLGPSGYISVYDPFGGAGPYTSTISGKMDIGASTKEIYIEDGNTLNITAVISSAAGAYGLTQVDGVDDTAGTLVLSGSNTYTGVTTVRAGTLVAANSSALGNASSAVLVGDTSGTYSASLLTSGAVTIDRDITVQTGNSGTTTIGGNTADSSTFSGDIALNKDVTLTAVNGGTTTFSGAISGSGGVSKSGAGTVVFSGGDANTYTGTTTVAAGTLELDKTAGVNAIAGPVTVGDGAGTDTLLWSDSDQIADSQSITLASGGALDLNGATDEVANLTITGGSTVADTTGRLIVEGNLTHGSGTFTNNGRVEVQGTFNAGGGTWAGDGTLLLTSSTDRTFTPPTSGAIYDLVIDDGLVGYWKLDETSGTLAADSSGYASDGTHTNSPTISTDVPSIDFTDPRSLSLDGTNDYVRIPRSTALEPAAVSVSLWVKRNGNQVAWANIFRKTGQNNTGPTSYALQLSPELTGDSSIVGFVTGKSGDPNADILNSPAGSVLDGTWVHVVGVYDPAGAAPQKKLYVDGSLVASRTVTEAIVYDSTPTGDLYIGQNGAPGEFFKGLADDIRVYRRALSSSQVAALAAGGQPAIGTAVQTLAGTLNVDGDLVLNGGALDVSPSNYAVNVKGSWINNGGVFVSRSGTVTLNGAGGGNTILSGGEDFNNLAITGSGTWTQADALAVSGNFSQSAGTFTGSSHTIDVDGSFSQSGGTFTSSSGRLQVEGSFTRTGGTFQENSGTVILDASSDTTFTPGGAVFNNLIVNDGLVGYWKLDETSGTLAADSSGYASHGTHINSPSISTNVPACEFSNPRSLNFNGTSQYVLADPPDPALNTVQNAITVSAWIYKTAADFSSWGVVAQRRKGTGDSDLWIFMINSGANDEYVFYPGTADNQYLVGPASTDDANTWVHIVGVYDGTTTKIYKNGVQVASHALNTGAISTDSTPLIIGAADNGTSGYQEFFQGNIDDVRVYNRALMAAQIAELAAGRQPGIGTATQTLGGTLDVNGDLVLNGGTLDVSATNYGVTVGGDWINNGGVFNSRAGTVTLDGASDQALQPGGETFWNLTINNTGADGDDDVTLGGDLDVDGTLTITNGTLVQGPWDINAGGITVGAGGAWENQSTGDVALGAGGVDNSGTILLDGGGGGWGDADSIDITSTSPGSQRPWVGAGDFFLYDTNVTDQGGTASVTVSSGTNVGGNGANFYFVDNPVVGITVDPTSGLETTEAGGTDTFTVVLTSQPTDDVTIGITSEDLTEGTVSPASLTFTTGNWFTPQTVTVTGVDDGATDGNILYTITTAAAVSADTDYSGLNADNVTATNLDNEAGITVSAISGSTTEAGGTATFTIVLQSQPTANVTIDISSSDTTEGTVSPASVTFTNGNWSTPQTVTVTGVDDSLDDGNIAYMIVTDPAVSTDGAYSGLNASNVSVTNTDNDTAGITVTPTSGLTTTEAGGQATFTVVLDTQPTADVTIGISSSDTTEGTVSPSSLTFTSGTWNIAQTVTVTGVNDDVDDGNIAYTILTAAATSADAGYNGMNASDVTATNTDNDTAGITVTPTSGLETTEAGGTDTFTVVLDSEPTADVTIGLSSSDTTEGTVGPASLTFTSGNWDTPQTVTVTGVDDATRDEDVAYTIVTAAAVSTDGNYSGVNASDVSVTNIDDEPAVRVVPTSGLTTTEAGGTATFTLALATQPTADVTIGLSSSDTTEGTVSPSSVTFTNANWSTTQTITVTGVNDSLDDGDIAYTIITAAATSVDVGYNGLDGSDVTVTNTDNDAAGVTVTPTSGLLTTEAGVADTFTVVLTSQPTADVTIGLSSSDTTEGTVSPSSLTFTSANWSTPQTVTVTGVNDDVDDGNIAYTIVTAAATSADGTYNNLNAGDVSATNVDNDTAGVTVTPTSGLTTTEAAGTATFTVALASQPTADVTIGISSSDTTEGTVSPASVIFTSANWSTPQTVTVTGVNDDVDDGNIAYTIVTTAATSADGTYSGVNASDVTATNTDNDTAGITVAPTSDLLTTEGGGTDTFTVVLDTEPTADVTIGITSSDTAEGTVSPASLTFTAANWDTPQTVTVTGVNDGVVDGHRWYGVVIAAATSADGTYNGMNAADLQAINLDDDASGIVVLETSHPYTTEAGGTATFVVVLAKLPTADVTVGITSSDTTEGTVAPASLTFTAANWNTPQTVTVTGVDDGAADGHIRYAVVTAAAASADAAYSGLNPDDVELLNLDNDAASVAILPTSGLITTEGGGADTFIAVLARDPSANVTIGISSSDTAEGTVSPSSLTFTISNWAAPQTVTVTGADDAIADGNRSYSVVTAAAVSADGAYSGINPDDVSVLSIDDDAAGVTVVPTADLMTTEGGGTDSFVVILNRAPTGDVTISLASSDTTEGTVSPASLTFTTSNWGVPRTVTLTGVNDADVDGHALYTIITGAAASSDASYDGLNPSDVSAVNLDDDAADVAVIPTQGLVTTEAGATDTFRAVLARAPTANVTVPVASSDTSEGAVSTAALTFTTSNWSVPQTVTLTGADDAIVDGNRAYATILGPSVSVDASYNAMIPDAVLAVNLDNDAAAVTVAPTSGLITTEGGGAAEFTVTLNKLPTANVTISLASSNTSEGTVSPPILIFTASNWSVPRTVTITGADDASADGNREYSIVTGAASSADGAYDGLNPADVEVLNLDDDAAGIAVVPTSGLLTTEWGRTDTFRVVLGRAPSASVAITLSSSDTTEGAVSPATLTFTTTNWSAPQLVTVTGVNDSATDGNVAYTAVTGTAVSSDGDYHGLDPDDVSVTNLDDDDAGVTALPVSGLATAENGGGDTFIVILNRIPAAEVTVGLSSSDTTEGTVVPSSLAFGPTSWFVPQTVEITGVDDFEPDGDVAYAVITAAAVSADGAYSGINASDVSVTNEDDDVLNAVVTPVGGLITTEAGGSDTFTVVLSSRPTADVTISLTSNHTGEGTVAPASLTFTSADWDTPQTVTVTGVDDAVADGNVVYTILTGAAVSADGHYNGLNLPDVTVTNLDNEAAAISVVPTSGLVTTENGSTATFRVVLNVAPAADVTMGLASSNTAEGTVSPASLTFTAANWSTPQTVTATGVDDADIDGARLYTMVTAAAASADGAYGGFNPADVALTNLDNDEPLVAVWPVSGLITTETGGTDLFYVVLTRAPTADVTIALSSSDDTEGTVLPSSLTFTTSDWSTVRLVSVSGVDDVDIDGNVTYTVVTRIASSEDLDFDGLNPADVFVTNVDDDASGITVVPTSGLVTSEGGGAATFRVLLNQAPSADVTVGLSSSDATEGTVAPASLTFTSANWSASQTVTVTGADDADADGNVAYSAVTAAAASADGAYSGLDAADVSLINLDDETKAVTVIPTTGLTTSEYGQTAAFTVVLNKLPTADVTIALSVSDATEGAISPASLTFTTSNWSVPRTVTLTGADDDAVDGDIAYFAVTGFAVSADAGYNNMNPDNVAAVNFDNDGTAGGITVTPTGGLTTTEGAEEDLFTVVLAREPTANVTVSFTTSDATEGTISPAYVTFTSANWDTAQTITVTGVDDSADDGDVAYTILTARAQSADDTFDNVNPSDVSVTNEDDDVAGTMVTPTRGLLTTEGGGIDAFSVRLTSQPTANVTIGITSSDTGEATVSTASLTFTTTDWNTPQVVTATGVDDADLDGNAAYTIVTAPAVSVDASYNGFNPSNVRGINVDNDQPGIIVVPTSRLLTSEAGLTDEIRVVLNEAPAADVTIPLATSDAGEATIAPASLTFTPANWDIPQAATVTGVDDLVADGHQEYMVLTGLAASGDPVYDGMNPADARATNLDNETPDIAVTPTSGLVTAESGGSDTFVVMLTTLPSSSVTIPISSSDATAGTASVTSVTFTTSNWNVPQTVVVTGANNGTAGNIAYTIVTGPAASADADYAGMNASDVSVTAVDDDTAGITVIGPATLMTSESGRSDSFEVVLNTAPSATVTIPLSASDAAEGSIAPASLVFTTSSWSSPQTVVITGVDDSSVDGDVAYAAVTGAAVSGDAGYNNLNAANVNAVNLDNDSPSPDAANAWRASHDDAGFGSCFGSAGGLPMGPSAGMVLLMSLALAGLGFRRRKRFLWGAMILLAGSPAFASPPGDNEEAIPFMDLSRWEVQPVAGAAVFSGDFDADPSLAGGVLARLPLPRVLIDNVWAFGEALVTRIDRDFTPAPPEPDDTVLFFAGGADWEFVSHDEGFVTAQAGLIYSDFGDISGLDGGFAPMGGLMAGVRTGAGVWVNLAVQMAYSLDTKDSVAFLLAGVQIEY